MQKNFFLIITIIFLLASLQARELHKKNVFSVPEYLVGNWQGYGREIVSWCNADSIFFSINIYKDGSVSGKIGDAILTNGYIIKNSKFLRMLKNPRYLIGGDLRGYIVDDIKREKLRWLMLDYKNGNLVGGFSTSGNKGNFFKNKNKISMKLTGIDVKLSKTK